MVQKIITIPNPILRQKSKEVFSFDKKLVQLVRDLKDTLLAADNPKGIGLSAPQIGIGKQVLIIKIQKKIIPMVNPAIVFSSKETLSQTVEEEKKFLEGCLSVPGYWSFIDRPYCIKTEYLDIFGTKKIIEFEGKNSSLFQHEYDHLEGILFIDRALQQKSKIYKIEKNERDEDELVEVTLG